MRAWRGGGDEGFAELVVVVVAAVVVDDKRGEPLRRRVRSLAAAAGLAETAVAAAAEGDKPLVFFRLRLSLAAADESAGDAGERAA